MGVADQGLVVPDEQLYGRRVAAPQQSLDGRVGLGLDHDVGGASAVPRDRLGRHLHELGVRAGETVFRDADVVLEPAPRASAHSITGP